MLPWFTPKQAMTALLTSLFKEQTNKASALAD
jgi:hypothetical protein